MTLLRICTKHTHNTQYMSNMVSAVSAKCVWQCLTYISHIPYMFHAPCPMPHDSQMCAESYNCEFNTRLIAYRPSNSQNTLVHSTQCIAENRDTRWKRCRSWKRRMRNGDEMKWNDVDDGNRNIAERIQEKRKTNKKRKKKKIKMMKQQQQQWH